MCSVLSVKNYESLADRRLAGGFLADTNYLKQASHKPGSRGRWDPVPDQAPWIRTHGYENRVLRDIRVCIITVSSAVCWSNSWMCATAAWRWHGQSFGRVHFGGKSGARSERVSRMLRRNLTAEYSDRHARNKIRKSVMRVLYNQPTLF